MQNARSYLAAALFSSLVVAGCGIDLVDTVQDVFTDDPLADLHLQSPTGTTLTCLAGPSVVVSVENRGEADARESVTTVVFVPGGSVDVRTPALGQSETIQLDPVTVPTACFVPNCGFTVLADASFLVDESDENNNRLDGSCPAPQ